MPEKLKLEGIWQNNCSAWFQSLKQTRNETRLRTPKMLERKETGPLKARGDSRLDSRPDKGHGAGGRVVMVKIAKIHLRSSEW